MFGNVGRRLVEGTVGLFALLGFLYVPLGRHTGFEHARAVFTTPAASAAWADLTQAVVGLRQRALELVSGRGQPDAAGFVAPPPGRNGPSPLPPKLK